MPLSLSTLTKCYDSPNIRLYRGTNAKYSNPYQQLMFIRVDEMNLQPASYFPNTDRVGEIAFWFDCYTNFTTWYVFYKELVTMETMTNVLNTFLVFKQDFREIYFLNVFSTTNFTDGIATNDSRTVDFFRNLAFNTLGRIVRFYVWDNKLTVYPSGFMNSLSIGFGTYKTGLIFFRFSPQGGYITTSYTTPYGAKITNLSGFASGDIIFPNHRNLLGAVVLYVPNTKANSNLRLPTRSTANLPTSLYWANSHISNSEINSNPTCIVSDGTYVYVANNATNSITRIKINDTANANFNWITTGINSPFGLAFDNNNNLYVSNYGLFKSTGGTGLSNTNTISKFSITDGVPTLITSSWVSGLNGPAALVCDSTYLYVTELGKYENNMFTGNSIRKISITDPTMNTILVNDLDGPIGVAINNNILYVSNNNSNYVSKIEILDDGSVLENNTWIDIPGPIGLAVFNNKIYIVSNDINNNVDTIYRYSLDYNNLNNQSIDFGILDSSTFSLAIDAKNFYISNYNNANIRQLENYSESSIITANICFTENTPILTDQGYIPICNVRPNFHTIHNKKIVDVTKTKGIDDYLICFDKDAISIDCPTEKTIMSKDHKVCYNGIMQPAYNFVNKFEKVNKVKYNGELLYNILMEEHTIIKANNMICETLSPDNLFAKMYTRQCKYSKEEKERIINILDESMQKKDYKRFKQVTKHIK